MLCDEYFLMNFVIEYLADHPDSIGTIARWHHDQWHHLSPNISFEQRRKQLSCLQQRSEVPTMFVVVHNGKVIGTAALLEHDMDTHKELSPWLASVYVEKRYRRKGVGQNLVHRVIKEARSIQIKNLYLFTPDQERFYKHFGWEILFREEYHGEQESVMVLHISV